MAKIKHTKNELKAQKLALARYRRFLPMLQLKKQQLQAEILRIDREIEQAMHGETEVLQALESWIDLFSEDTGIEKLLTAARFTFQEHNIAGVNVPVLKHSRCDWDQVDLFATPPWIDAGMAVIEKLIDIRAMKKVLEEQKRLIGEELRVTNQRVNLFEKVKIPQCRENIRVIKIFLGDEQTAGVVRAKLAKSRQLEYQYADGQQ